MSERDAGVSAIPGMSGFWALWAWRSEFVLQRLLTLRAIWLQDYAVSMRSVPGPHALPCPASCHLQPGLVSFQPAASHFFPHPGLWQAKLKPQGSLVFNRWLLKMLTGSLSHPAWHCGTSHCLTKIRSWNCSLWTLLWACPRGGTACLLHGSPSETAQLGFLLILEAIVIFSAPLGHPFTCFVNLQSSFCL